MSRMSEKVFEERTFPLSQYESSFGIAFGFAYEEEGFDVMDNDYFQFVAYKVRGNEIISVPEEFEIGLCT